MPKTLVVILNHNLPEYTNYLYNGLKPYQKNDYDLKVIDNGSLPELTPMCTDIKFKNNKFWGGALNEAFKIILNQDIYDSLLFLNNDIELTSEIFVKTLREELLTNNLAIVTPCIAGRAQPWKQMQNWGSKDVRIVKWIDMQAPLIHRKLIEQIGQFDDQLFYGWGQELICYDICHEKNWQIGVCDFVTILHYGKQTLIQKRLFDEDTIEKNNKKNHPVKHIDWDDFKANAYRNYLDYFSTHKLKHESFESLINYGKEYQFANDKKTI